MTSVQGWEDVLSCNGFRFIGQLKKDVPATIVFPEHDDSGLLKKTHKYLDALLGMCLSSFHNLLVIICNYRDSPNLTQANQCTDQVPSVGQTSLLSCELNTSIIGVSTTFFLSSSSSLLSLTSLGRAQESLVTSLVSRLTSSTGRFPSVQSSSSCFSSH